MSVCIHNNFVIDLESLFDTEKYQIATTIHGNSLLLWWWGGGGRLASEFKWHSPTTNDISAGFERFVIINVELW